MHNLKAFAMHILSYDISNKLQQTQSKLQFGIFPSNAFEIKHYNYKQNHCV